MTRRTILGVLTGAVLAIVLIEIRGEGGGGGASASVESPAGTAADDRGQHWDQVVREVRPTHVMGVLAAQQPLRLAVAGSFGPEPGRDVKLFLTSQDLYHGPMSRGAVEALLEKGRAHALEHRLSPDAAERLRDELREFDLALRDMSLLMDELEADTRTALRQRADRSVVIRTQPKELDPAFPEFLRLRPARGEGTIWGEPYEAGERYLAVLWSEWPELKMLYDDRSLMLVDRQHRVRIWIEAEFRQRGMAILDDR